MWDMMELNFCDWAWPHENGTRSFGQIGAEIDQKMRDVFWEQDKYHVRTNFKSVVECYDRGLEFFRSPLLHDDQGNQVRTLMDPFLRGIENAEKDSKNFYVKGRNIAKALKDWQDRLKQTDNSNTAKFEATKMFEGLTNASPISLWATTLLLMKCWKMHEKRLPKTSPRSENPNIDEMMATVGGNVLKRKDFLPTTFLKLEYRVLVWLMQRGDFWNGVRMKVYRGDKLLDPKFETVDDLADFLTTKDGEKMMAEFEQILAYPTLDNPQWQDYMISDSEFVGRERNVQPRPLKDIFQNENIRDLDLPHIPLRDTLVHPEFTLPGLTWKGTEHYDQQLRKQVYFHYDYAMLRGPSHPDMDILLHQRSPDWRRQLMQQGVKRFQEVMHVSYDMHTSTRATKSFNDSLI